MGLKRTPVMLDKLIFKLLLSIDVGINVGVSELNK